MAWDPSSSAWDWETDVAIMPPYQVNELDHRKMPLSGWPCEAAVRTIKHDRSSSQSLVASEARCGFSIPEGSQADLTSNRDFHNDQIMTPAMATLRGPSLLNDAGANDHANGSLGSVVQKGVSEGHADEARGISQTNENGWWVDKRTQMSIKQSHLSEDKQGVVELFSERDHISPSKPMRMGSTCNHRKVTVVDEQCSSSAVGSAFSDDSPTGLQLGKRTYPLDVVSPVAIKATVKSNTPAKKLRGTTSVSQVPRCQVEGCKLDLSDAKDYHRRHKVCEVHSKAGKVVVASLEQRFCQQCSRFHVLTEFDETKRSCRRRLAGHNKRRRKPRPDPLELQAQLRPSFEEWPFFGQSSFPRVGCWQGPGRCRSSLLWPMKLMQYYKQPTLDCSLQGSGTDGFMKGISSSLNREKVPLLLLQSPKTVMSKSSGVYASAETTPVMDVTRVSDSGRALSLLSLQLQCSQAPDTVSLHLSGLTNALVNENSHQMQQDTNAFLQQQYLPHGQHPYWEDFSTALSMNSNAYRSSDTGVCEGITVVSAGEDLFEGSFLTNFHRNVGDYKENDCLTFNKHLQSQFPTGHMKQTQNLMHSVSVQVPYEHCQSPSSVFNVDSSALSEAHFSGNTSFSKF